MIRSLLPSILALRDKYCPQDLVSVYMRQIHVVAKQFSEVIEGGVNDPAPVPPPSPTHGSYHWVFERAMSAALIPLTIAPFAAGSLNPVMDALLCAGLIIHSHIGFQSIVIDYVPDKRLPKTRAFFWWALRAATVVTAIGFFEFETNDVGLTEAIKRIWTAKRKEESYVEPILRGVA
ncbi:MAG: hypothetical protein Q9171_007479 [Xanthocarpia ochracea]